MSATPLSCLRDPSRLTRSIYKVLQGRLATSKQDAPLNLNFRETTNKSLLCVPDITRDTLTIQKFIVYLKLKCHRMSCVFSATSGPSSEGLLRAAFHENMAQNRLPDGDPLGRRGGVRVGVANCDR